MRGGRSSSSPRHRGAWRTRCEAAPRGRAARLILTTSAEDEPHGSPDRAQLVAGVDRGPGVDLATFPPDEPAHAHAALPRARAALDPPGEPPDEHIGRHRVKAGDAEPRGTVERGPHDLGAHGAGVVA